MNRQESWKQFRLRIVINAPVSLLFDLWTLEESLTTWFVKEAKFIAADGHSRKLGERIQTGDRYRWTWWNGVKEDGHLLDVDPNQRVKFTFGLSEGVPVTVSVNFRSVIESRSEIELIQEEMGLSEQSKLTMYAGGLQGWTFYLTNLKSLIEGGIDLREKEYFSRDDGQAGRVNV